MNAVSSSGGEDSETAPQPETGPAESVSIKQVARGGIWSLSGKLLVLIASLVGTPFTLRLLRPAEFGLWSLMLTIATYLVVVDFGMATGSTKLAGEAYTRGESNLEAEVIWTAATVGSVSATFFAIILAFWGQSIVELLSVPQALQGTAVVVLRLVGLTLVLRVLTTVVNTPSLVRLRWRGLTLATAGPAIALPLVAPICLVVIGGGVLTMATLTLAAAMIALSANAGVAFRSQRALRSPRFNLEVARKLIRYGVGLTATALVVLPLATAERFLLAHYWSPTVVAPYAVALTLAGVLILLPVAATDPLFPAFVRMIEARQWIALTNLYSQSSRALFLILVPTAMFLAFVSKPFLMIYAGPEYGAKSSIPFLILIVGVVVNALAYIPYMFLLACGRVKTILAIHLVEIIPYIFLAIWLTSQHQAIGAAIAWTSRVFFDGLALLVIAGREERLQHNRKGIIQARDLPVLAALGACLLLAASAQVGLVARFVIVCILVPVYGLAAFRVVLSGRERSLIVKQLHRLRGE